MLAAAITALPATSSFETGCGLLDYTKFSTFSYSFIEFCYLAVILSLLLSMLFKNLPRLGLRQDPFSIDHFVLDGKLHWLRIFDEIAHDLLRLCFRVGAFIGDHGRAGAIRDHILPDSNLAEFIETIVAFVLRNPVPHCGAEHEIFHCGITAEAVEHGRDTLGGVRESVVTNAVQEQHTGYPNSTLCPVDEMHAVQLIRPVLKT